ncbi:cupin domain-containing protein [Actinoplanes bogorensis]|uniref:Cupin domain-containing protein n=1 Tax=Paractinoplanes bogorensis TaxID=1610840 RepID=A0ABS5YPY3_9ACTN|nr:cupin domain-containing protein [Actinoplanes bogorensis]MBU2665518.1 cupin domain-containing protein [Actinoplanes bogorensis]
MPTAIEQTLRNLGPRLRAIRQRNGATLAALSVASGIPVSTLSRLEKGHRLPTLEQVLALAAAHAVSVDDLLDGPPTGDARVHLRPVTRNGKTLIPLTRRPGGIQAYKLILPGEGPPATPAPNTHDGYEWLYVLNGTLRLVLGDQEMLLTPGQAAEFDTRAPHWFGAAGSQPAEILALLGVQGERMHTRATATIRTSAER